MKKWIALFDSSRGAWHMIDCEEISRTEDSVKVDLNGLIAYVHPQFVFDTPEAAHEFIYRKRRQIYASFKEANDTVLWNSCYNLPADSACKG